MPAGTLVPTARASPMMALASDARRTGGRAVREEDGEFLTRVLDQVIVTETGVFGG